MTDQGTEQQHGANLAGNTMLLGPSGFEKPKLPPKVMVTSIPKLLLLLLMTMKMMVMQQLRSL